MKIEAVIFDCGRTLFDPELNELFPETINVLEGLKARDIKIGLLSVAVTDDINPRINQINGFGLMDYFDSIDIVPRNTVGKNFEKVIVDLETTPKKCLIIGDNLKREIENGNKIGAYTVWTKQKLSANWTPQNERQIPKKTINNLEELIPLIDGLAL